MDARISLITLGVADLARARRFYHDALGLQPQADSPDGIAFFELRGLYLALYPRDALAADIGLDVGSGDTSHRFSGVTLAYNVTEEAEVEALLECAKAAGATIVKAAERVFWGGYSGYFADPDGHLWEVATNPAML